MLASCGKSAKIDLTLEGAAEKPVVLQKLNYNKLQVIDTLMTDKGGKVSCKVELPDANPAFYYLYYNDSKIAGLILLPGEKAVVKADTIGRYTVEGSEESANLKAVDDAYAEAYNKLSRIAATINDNSTEAEVKEANRELSKTYIDHKRAMLKHITGNFKSITSATVLFQKFNDNLYLFSEPTDIFIFRTVYDSLKSVYPKSEYLAGLQDEINARQQQYDLANHFENASESIFPDITMPDIEGKKRKLSEVEAKLIILNFWSVAQTEHKLFNNDLLDIYKKYHSQGLEVYQVSLDIDKPTWAGAVKSQKLPWISVNDGYGIDSPSVSTYNVQTVPSMYLLSTKSGLVARDLFDPEKLEEAIRRNL